MAVDLVSFFVLLPVSPPKRPRAEAPAFLVVGVATRRAVFFLSCRF